MPRYPFRNVSRACKPLPDNPGFAVRLKERRAALGLSPVELAGRSGVSVQTVEMLEAQATLPSVQTLEKLAEVLEMTMDQLWKGHVRA